MKRKKSYKFVLLIMVAFLSFVLLSTSTYAWFSVNRSVRIDQMNIKVDVSGGIEISADALNWYNHITTADISTVYNTTYLTSVNQLPTTFEPVSTSGETGTNGFLNFYLGNLMSDEDTNYYLTSSRSIESSNNENGNFIAFDMFLRVNNPYTLYIDSDSGAFYTGEEEFGAENATRVAFVNEGTIGYDGSHLVAQALNNGSRTYIWEPNYNSHSRTAIENARNMYGMNISADNSIIPYSGVIKEITEGDAISVRNANASANPSFFRNVNVDIATRNDYTAFQELMTLTPGITKIRIYIWIEGQDIDCENGASSGNFDFVLQLTTNPA